MERVLPRSFITVIERIAVRVSVNFAAIIGGEDGGRGLTFKKFFSGFNRGKSVTGVRL